MGVSSVGMAKAEVDGVRMRLGIEATLRVGMTLRVVLCTLG
jgi:hypothetical protein